MEDKHEVNDHKTLAPVTHSGEATVSDAVSLVKEKCWDQREALLGEPCCVICGRYGEYICDETDDDICSIECKSTLLGRLSNAQKREKLPHQVRIPVVDECVYVRNNDDDILKAPSLSNNEVEVLRNKLEIQVKGGSVPPPILSFSSCNLSQKVQKNLEAAGYEVPTPIQMQAIPIALTGRNLLVSAATGSGKTASFLVPIVSRCSKFRLANPTNQRKPLAMVLAPTRELCVQVEEQAKVLGNGLPFKTALVVGGEPMAGQIYRIHHGVELIVGTPGRLIDLLTKHNVELDEVSILALDEVDCMLERGFRDQVMQVFLALSQPQILMYSATVPPEVENIGSLLAKDLVFVTAGKNNGTNKSVKQIAIWVESKHKKRKLFEILMSQQHFKPPVVVFVGSRLGADLLSEAITVTTGIKALPFHGEKPMKERRNTLRLFLTGEVSIIVATGVLGRGVDLLKVRQVIVFDMPNSIKEYIHQIGRASRLGEEGTAFLFLNEEDKNLFQDLVGILKSSGAVIPRELANSRRIDTDSAETKYSKSPSAFILKTMLKAPDHQVAGHQAHAGKLGPLVDDSGHFYKPLQSDERGTKEAAFYSSFSSNSKIPTAIRRFFPTYHGTQLLEASDGSGMHLHLVLQDIVSNRLDPSVMDIKMGSRTWYPQASEDYITKCLKKDRESTSVPLGFRISGLQTYESEKLGYWKPDKKVVQDFTLEDVKSTLKRFVSSNPSSNAEPDCLLASIIYGGSDGILAQLLELKAWFEDQAIYQFYSCSVLMVYEKAGVGEEGFRSRSGAEVKLVDFAHVVDGEGVIDHNFLGGLCSLIKFVSDILVSSTNRSKAEGDLKEQPEETENDAKA